MKKTLASLAALALALGGVALALPVAASADQTDMNCEDLDSGKLDTDDDPATVAVDAPPGKLIDGYCVKAGTTSYYIQVDPPAAHVVIDHPDKDSVSHYSLSYVDIVDVCPNIEGNQAEVPDGLVLIEGSCEEPPVDVCPNLEGNQAEIPEGRIDYQGACIIPLVAAAALISDPADCFGAQSIELGAIENATWGAITDPAGDELDYSVTAFANGNARFPGNLTELTFSGSLDDQLDPENPLCEVPTLDLVLPAVSKTDITCTGNGSYTLGAAEGYDAALLTWTVNGEAKATGTYPVTGAAELEIVATAVDPHGLEPEWENPATLSFAEPSEGVCDDLTTLALTGQSDPTPWGSSAVTMLLAGVVVLLARKRMTVQ